MNQLTNLKSQGFTWKKIYWEYPRVSTPYIYAILVVVDNVAKLVFVSVVVEADDSPAPTL